MKQKIKINFPYKVSKSNTSITSTLFLYKWQPSTYKISRKEVKYEKKAKTKTVV